MSRFGEEQDPLFRRINSSISFDWRLASFDIEQSKAHARALAKLGVLDDAELGRSPRASTGSAASSTRASFEFREEDEDIHMAIERRLTELIGPLGGKLHTRAHGTTRSRPTWRCWCGPIPRGRSRCSSR